MKQGFYFFYAQKEYFCISNKKNKCKSVAVAFLQMLGAPVNENNIKYVLNNTTKATLEYRPYLNIFGDTFNGYGDANTIVFNE